MQVAIKCKSFLLEKTLSIFLKDYLSTSDKCDVLVSDGFIKTKNNLFIISDRDNANLSLPFSKEELINSLATYPNKYDNTKVSSANENNTSINNQPLEREIDSLMQEYTKKILLTIKKYKNF